MRNLVFFLCILPGERQATSVSYIDFDKGGVGGAYLLKKLLIEGEKAFFGLTLGAILRVVRFYKLYEAVSTVFLTFTFHGTH